jgi:hypothetical protein
LTHKCIYTFIHSQPSIHTHMYNYFYLVVLNIFLFNIFLPFQFLWFIWGLKYTNTYILACTYLYMFYYIDTHIHMWIRTFRYMLLCILLHLYICWTCCMSLFYLIGFLHIQELHRFSIIYIYTHIYMYLNNCVFVNCILCVIIFFYKFCILLKEFSKF